MAAAPAAAQGATMVHSTGAAEQWCRALVQLKAHHFMVQSIDADQARALVQPNAHQCMVQSIGVDSSLQKSTGVKH